MTDASRSPEWVRADAMTSCIEMGDTVGRLLKISDVCAETGLSRATIYRCIKDAENPFPAPMKIGKTSRRSSAEIVAWKRRLRDTRDTDRKPAHLT